MSFRNLDKFEKLDSNDFQVKRKPSSRQTSFSLDSSIESRIVTESPTLISPKLPVEQVKVSMQVPMQTTMKSSEKSVLSTRIAEKAAEEKQDPSFSLLPSIVDTKLFSHGPYVRVYEKNQQSPERKATPSVKYTSIIDVSSNRERLYSTTYPTVIKVPLSISKIQISVSPGTRSSNSLGLGAPSTITLSRPTSSKVRYQRSNKSSSSTRPDTREHHDPAQPNLPFLQMTNALQLYLKLSVLEDTERIMVWAPGSFLIQSNPFIEERSFSFRDLFSKQEEKDYSTAPPQNFPAYLLLTNKHVYVAKPLFRLAKLKHPLQDEQTSYLNPSKLIDICYKIPIMDTTRLDVGPGRQYLAFHTIQKETIFSLVFQTRSRQTSTVIIDTITTLVHEHVEVNPQAKTLVMNQDVEWSIKSIQDQVLLYPGPKSTSILSYSHIWPNSEKYIELTDKEFDTGIQEQISKVDFDFVKMYLFGVYMRYFKPVVDTEIRGVEIQHTTIFGSREYLYLLQERLDAWPPSVFPPDATKQYPSFPIQRTKGFLVDLVSPFQVLGVGRMEDITRIERWRSWRIDESFGSDDPFRGLGSALQNGHVGYLNKSLPLLHQQASAGGWYWWIRVHFGTVTETTEPLSSPRQVPICGYWWDIAFATRESSEDFIETIKVLKASKKSDCKIIIGDD
jgi:hypothetical protein